MGSPAISLVYLGLLGISRLFPPENLGVSRNKYDLVRTSADVRHVNLEELVLIECCTFTDIDKKWASTHRAELSYTDLQDTCYERRPSGNRRTLNYAICFIFSRESRCHGARQRHAMYYIITSTGVNSERMSRMHTCQPDRSQMTEIFPDRRRTWADSEWTSREQHITAVARVSHSMANTIFFYCIQNIM